MFNNRAAKDEMRQVFYDRFRSYLTAGLPNEVPPIPPLTFIKRGGVTPYIPRIVWQAVETRTLTDSGEHWLRVSSQNLLKRQKSLTGGRNQSVGTHYTTQGLFRVELYFSKSAFQSTDMDNLNLIVERCFIQGNDPCGVWFRNAIIVDMEPEENYFRSLVMADYEFESVIK